MAAPISATGQGDEADVRVELHCRHHDMVTDPEAVRTIIAILRAARALAPGAPAAPATSSHPLSMRAA